MDYEKDNEMQYPKPKRVVDPELIARVKAVGICYLVGRGECWGPLDPHHVISRGAGGGDTEDNVILLCRNHHQQAHSGLISKETLRSYMTEANIKRIKRLKGE